MDRGRRGRKRKYPDGESGAKSKSSSRATPTGHAPSASIPNNDTATINGSENDPLTGPPGIGRNQQPPPAEKRNLMATRLANLIHACNCQLQEKANENVGSCRVSFCLPLRNVLNHIATCNSGKLCQIDHCAASRQIIFHCQNCTGKKCFLCKPLENMNPGNKLKNLLIKLAPGLTLQKACKYGKVPLRQLRLMIVGHRGAGKTYLKCNLTNKEFTQDQETINGIETDCSTCTVSIDNTCDWQDTKDAFPDYEQAMAEFLSDVYDDEVPQEINLDDVDTSIIRALLEDPKTKENRDKIRLRIWDFAGQGVFYTTHQTFLTDQAIYILVLDVTKGKKEKVPTYREGRHCKVRDRSGPQTVEEFCDYWLSCIHTHAAPTDKGGVHHPHIVIALTHTDKLSEEKKKKEIEKFQESVFKFIENKPYSNYVYKKMFPVSNTVRNEKDLDDLRAAIIHLAQNQHYWGSPIPAKWLKLKDKLYDLKYRGENTTTFNDLSKLATTVGVSNADDDLKNCLKLLHALGDILYFDDEGLRDLVILDPQWIIDRFKKVITVSANHKQLRFPNSEKHWANLEDKAILDPEVMEHVWGEEKDKILNLMMKFQYLLPLLWQSESGGKKEVYIVPNFLRPKNPKPRALKDLAPIYISFPSQLIPLGLFGNLVTSLVNEDKWKIAGGQIYKNYAWLQPRNHATTCLQILYVGGLYSFELKAWPMEADRRECPNLHTYLKVIKRRLEAIIRNTSPKLAFEISFQCPLCEKQDKHVVPVMKLGKKMICSKSRYCDKHAKYFDTERWIQWFDTSLNQKKRPGPCQKDLAAEDEDRRQEPTYLGIRNNPIRRCAIQKVKMLYYPPTSELKLMSSLKVQDKLLDDGITKMVEESTGSKPVIVALLDSGVREDHPDLKEAGIIIHNKNFVINEGEEADLTLDANGHGTFCAGIYLQHSPSVKILNLKVLDKACQGGQRYIAEALKYICDWDAAYPQNKVDIISISIGSVGHDDQVSTLINHLHTDKVIVCAASNNGQRAANTILFPARHEHAIAIGSCDNDGNRCGHSGIGKELSFLFPGKEITSTFSKYDVYGKLYLEATGTSFAAPYAGATVAVLLQYIGTQFKLREKFTNTRIMKELLKDVCCRRGFKEECGYGFPELKRLNDDRIRAFINDQGLTEEPMGWNIV